MGQAKSKQYSREQFLREHTLCCYCGASATTVDHCPARAIFYDRQWPEGYEFPACHQCNDAARPDEQLMAVLAKVWPWKPQTPAQMAHWEKQLRGLKNNCPDFINEMLADSSRNDIRRSLRRLYGEKGDDLRRLGYGVATIGPETHSAIDRFTVKMGKALFYKHTGSILNGEIWHRHISMASQEKSKIVLETLASIVPFQSNALRGGTELHGQFIYRFNFTPGPEAILCAVVQFSDQIISNILAASKGFIDAVGGKLIFLAATYLQKLGVTLHNPNP